MENTSSSIRLSAFTRMQENLKFSPTNLQMACTGIRAPGGHTELLQLAVVPSDIHTRQAKLLQTLPATSWILYGLTVKLHKTLTLMIRNRMGALRGAALQQAVTKRFSRHNPYTPCPLLTNTTMYNTKHTKHQRVRPCHLEVDDILTEQTAENMIDQEPISTCMSTPSAAFIKVDKFLRALFEFGQLAPQEKHAGAGSGGRHPSSALRSFCVSKSSNSFLLFETCVVTCCDPADDNRIIYSHDGVSVCPLHALDSGVVLDGRSAPWTAPSCVNRLQRTS
ncbi:hypothetical protein PAMA_002677 [Pampus argenteus]